ncbi:hypothetical protein ACSNOI_36165, partial [Actinomadura kijaniata]
MQCPTCGSHTPGTLDRCASCDSPLNVPLGAPAAERAPDLGEKTVVVPPQGPAPHPPRNPAPAQIVEEKTMMVPPPTPSWAAEPPLSSAPSPAPRRDPADEGDGEDGGNSESTAPWA